MPLRPKSGPRRYADVENPPLRPFKQSDERHRGERKKNLDPGALQRYRIKCFHIYTCLEVGGGAGDPLMDL